MTDRNRVLVVRVVLGLLMTVTGTFMLAGCPLNSHGPLEPRAADTAAVHANR